MHTRGVPPHEAWIDWGSVGALGPKLVVLGCLPLQFAMPGDMRTAKNSKYSQVQRPVSKIKVNRGK